MEETKRNPALLRAEKELKKAREAREKLELEAERDRQKYEEKIKKVVYHLLLSSLLSSFLMLSSFHPGGISSSRLLEAKKLLADQTSKCGKRTRRA